MKIQITEKAQSPLVVLITVSSVLGVAGYILHNNLFFMISSYVCLVLLVCLTLMRIATTPKDTMIMNAFIYAIDALLLVIGCLIDRSFWPGLLLGVSMVGIMTIVRDQLTIQIVKRLDKHMTEFRVAAEKQLEEAFGTDDEPEYKPEYEDVSYHPMYDSDYDYYSDLDGMDDWGTIKCDENATLEERVKAMELAFNRACGVNGTIMEDFAPVEKNAGTMKELAKYMDSGLWQKDFEADEVGKLSDEIHRGVLSEDGLYTVLIEYKDMLKRFKAISEE